MIIVSGASGLVGRALCEHLRAQGKTVSPLVRREAKPGEIRWSPVDGQLEGAELQGARAVVHLAGESVVGRWTDTKKKRILESRVKGTRLIAEALANMDTPPEVLVCASAVGFYPDSTELLDESAAPGDEFLADVCKAWEAAAEPARVAGIRTVHVRIGLVLSHEGGALGSMLPAFKLGAGGKIGDGKQWMSWISRHDLVRLIAWAMVTPNVSGAINGVSPTPVQNHIFTETLGDVLGRPTFMTVPRFALKTILGEFSQELLVSHRIAPNKALEAGFSFEHSGLKSALEHAIDR